MLCDCAPQAKVKRITRELKDLRTGKTPLPCYAAGAIFLRHDQERLDVMRCLISGPEGTPYSCGLFVFDLLLPEGYPSIAPLMKIITTGDGRVRFNPNLYEDGKICLSLLGTFHGGHESEKWNPSVSSVYQIVLSIQSQLLVADPMFNEPAVAAIQGTREGDRKSGQYNADLRLSTMRYAINEVIQSPPLGFEEVVRGHFYLLRHKLMDMGKKWVEEAGGEGMPPQLQEKMDAEVCRMHALLQQLALLPE
jgi:ubiquitin-protein ligase